MKKRRKSIHAIGREVGLCEDGKQVASLFDVFLTAAVLSRHIFFFFDGDIPSRFERVSKEDKCWHYFI